MAKMSDVVEGLNILTKFGADAEDPECVSVEQDIMYCLGPNPDEMLRKTKGAAELVVLRDCGWRYDREHDCWRKFV